jgi:hypothetical protein
MSELCTDVMRATALIEREEVITAQLRFVLEPSLREELEMKLSEIRRELQILGFKTL